MFERSHDMTFYTLNFHKKVKWSDILRDKLNLTHSPEGLQGFSFNIISCWLHHMTFYSLNITWLIIEKVKLFDILRDLLTLTQSCRGPLYDIIAYVFCLLSQTSACCCDHPTLLIDIKGIVQVTIQIQSSFVHPCPNPTDFSPSV